MAATSLMTTVLLLCCVAVYGQKPCCSPDKWTAHLLQKTGAYDTDTGASKRDVSSRINYDYTLKKMSMFTETRNTTYNTSTFLQTIIDYNKGMEWRISGTDCTRHVTTEKMLPPCFLEGAEFFGYHKMAEMPVEVWFRDDGKGHSSRFTMARDPCVLVTETTRSIMPGYGSYELSFGIYENVTTGYVDPGVFSIPSICPRSGPVIKKYPKQTPMWPWYVPSTYFSPDP
ncbi:uncharacterized protein [Argopecten irradians]|uniref:uncharacterized protein n=1 Tax=Argopecten irradians TaxID=31199 RepID=UPI00372291EB